MSNDLDSAPTPPAPGHPVEGWLGALRAGELTLETVRDNIVALCSRDPEASWSALSWLDQYHRRRIIDRDIYLELKRGVTAVAMGLPATPRKPGPLPGASPGASPAPVAPRLAPGNTLAGRYELEAEIGKGAMAVVFRARDRERRDVRGVDERIAVKALREDLDSRDQALGILRRECFRTQALSHPNIVDVHGWERDGELRFVTLEFVDGQSLEEQLADLGQRRLPREQALAIVRGVGAAVAHAHARGVVHGDLKPANVMLGTDGRVRVLGFGVAIADPAAPDAATDEPRVVTPRYASPDVLAGLHAAPADDLFSLACMTCELLCGSVPFPDGDAAGAQRRRAKLRKPRGLHRRDWPLLRTALAPERGERPATVSAWLAGLDEEPRDAAAAPLDRVAPARRSLRFGPVRARLAAGLVLALLLAVLSTLPGPRAALERALDALVMPASAPAGRAASVPATIDAPRTTAATATPASGPVRATAAPTPRAAASPVAATPAPRERPVAAPVAAASAGGEAATTPTTTPERAERPFVGMVADTISARENNGAVRIPVQRYGNRSRALEFTWWTEGGSASPGADYADLDAQTARFPPGAERVTLVVPLVDDPAIEPPESFSVRIRVDRPGADPGFAASSVTIIDDDGASTEPATAPTE
jgi:hypothetical protein